ncbi:MAG: DUF2817 domain-containing protein [Nevskiales bacterium]|nr:DUF2817 domain-containing protein [Nevskiales bacterium]
MPVTPESLPELVELESLIKRARGHLRSEVLLETTVDGERLPVYCLEMGSASPEVPAVGFFGGVHGVERIGTQVILAFLHTLIERLNWDDSLAPLLARLRLVFVPLVNPGGMHQQTRANPAGVDLMRNAPVDAEGRAHWLLGGHRLSRHLPWYRGRTGDPMQPESQALCRVVEEKLFPHRFSLTLDCHSGFGKRDRIWFPYAHTHRPIDRLAEVYALRTMFRNTHPHHRIYVIEPQSRHYITHGDLWDCLYDRSKERARGPFIPLTLEMGSWLWIRKNPWQLFSIPGIFNPIKPHRHQRILRQHLTFLDFLVRATASYERWCPGADARPALFESAVTYWRSPHNPAGT